MKRASNRGARILAWLTDLAVFLPLEVLLIMIAQLPFLGSLSMLLIIIAGVASSVVFLVRDYLFHGSSIGKRIFRLRVVDADTLGGTISKTADHKESVSVFRLPTEMNVTVLLRWNPLFLRSMVANSKWCCMETAGHGVYALNARIFSDGAQKIHDK